MIAETSAREHLRYLDGLRGIAILMVVMVHVGEWPRKLPYVLHEFTFYGVRGVQLFFIVSGMTLMLAHLERPFEPANFYARRVFRIAPMFYFGLVLYLTLGIYTTLAYAPKNASIGEILSTLLFLHGWSIEANNKIVPGGWSIAAEMMFYLCFPLLLVLAKKRQAFVAGAALASYAVAGLTYALIRRYVSGDPAIVRAFAFAFWLCQLPAFATGCWLALASSKVRLSKTVAASLAIIAGAAILADSMLRGRTNLLISIALLSLLVWTLGQLRPRWLTGRLMPFLGTISFSIYLLHFAIVAGLSLVEPTLNEAVGPVLTFLCMYVATLVIVAPLAWVTYCVIEKPSVAFSRSLFRHALSPA